MFRIQIPCLSKWVSLSFLCSLIVIVPLSAQNTVLSQDPPFGGTIFIDPDIINETDSSAFETFSYIGQGMRTMYDRRVNDWVQLNAFLFDASFSDGFLVEVQVNPEFNSPAEAQVQVQKYLPYIGQLPTALRTRLATIWIHKGLEPFGGGNDNILIHTEQGDAYLADGILEETLLHEAAHTSLDPYYSNDANWLTAQQNDPSFISTYARDYPNREDIAESFVPYVALRYTTNRISESLRNTIETTIPHRIAFFDSLNLDMFPLVINTSTNSEEFDQTGNGFTLGQNYPNPFNPTTIIPFSVAKNGPITLRIFDVTGQLITTLANSYYTQGSYDLEWNADGMASGVYYYQLESATGTQTQKMLLLK